MRIFARVFLFPRRASPEESRRLLAAANPGSMVQAVRAGLARNERLVELLAAQTLQAGSSGGLLANKQEIDFLLRLAGTTQISRAIRDAGARKGEQFALVVAGENAVRLPTGLDAKELRTRKLSDAELKKIERAALLNAKRA